MSTTSEAVKVKNERRSAPWSLWWRQIRAVMRLEVNKSFLGKRAILLYLLSVLPVLLVAALAVFASANKTVRTVRDQEGNIVSQSIEVKPGPMQDIGTANQIYAGLFEGLILRTVIFFGCAWIFMNLFRGEVVDRSLHYYFLAPLRRELLVISKYLSGLVTALVLFIFTTGGSLFFLFYARGYSESSRYLFAGPGMRQVAAYLGITILACVGYGAFFLLIGLFFRNPIIPALLLYGWEWINFLLPPLLKKISVIHYLTSLLPVPISQGPFAVVAEPTPASLSVPGLLLLTLAVLFFACRRIRRMEISYGSD
jgi:ABC-type transport system involved in multi-copper enzyme maturation permease subunit